MINNTSKQGGLIYADDVSLVWG
ncbi:MAG TPA: hypothetical protein IAA37_04085 [Candidatus Eubacterium faecale]|uniref:Uncharacterized protein n=1 Tax=Candidatus Eubacterium faecale TaxID=2838568 RepID=A0A9D2S9G5_9FIRM|nr:hypothetical protein [Candidatus Eubacterium faecale]